MRVLVALLVVLFSASGASAENGHAAWLRYAPLPPDAAARAGAEVPRAIYRIGAEVPLARAEDELRKGRRGHARTPRSRR
jgi:alpha-glucuronidase